MQLATREEQPRLSAAHSRPSSSPVMPSCGSGSPSCMPAIYRASAASVARDPSQAGPGPAEQLAPPMAALGGSAVMPVPARGTSRLHVTYIESSSSGSSTPVCSCLPHFDLWGTRSCHIHCMPRAPPVTPAEHCCGSPVSVDSCPHPPPPPTHTHTHTPTPPPLTLAVDAATLAVDAATLAVEAVELPHGHLHQLCVGLTLGARQHAGVWVHCGRRGGGLVGVA